MEGPVFTAFMKGLSASYPVARPSVVQWILEVVLVYLGSQDPMGNLSPWQLYSKTLFLGAITSARRVCELAHLGWRKNDLIITHQDATISYLPNFIAKNETPSNLHRRVRIEKMCLSKDDPDKHVCPVRALLYWRDHLRSLTNPSDGLFQSPQGEPQSARQISRHLVDIIREAHSAFPESKERLLRVRAHDVRQIGATLMWQRTHEWATLASSFSWKNMTVFVNHYNQKLLETKRMAWPQ